MNVQHMLKLKYVSTRLDSKLYLVWQWFLLELIKCYKVFDNPNTQVFVILWYVSFETYDVKKRKHIKRENEQNLKYFLPKILNAR